ncbi:MAG TPA: hypothetical protein VMZ28_15515, partial [Kofleriaceae bacterium]|nr:hypothetical protein [Kofleriaceae bacterium]
RVLLDLASRPALDVGVRTRAVAAVEANLPWEREALAAVAATAATPPGRSTEGIGRDDQPHAVGPVEVRVAAAQTVGAFASPAELFALLGPLVESPEAPLRGAFLWALQLAVRPFALDRPGAAADRVRARTAVERLLADDDVAVRRRAAYVAGNLELDELTPALVALARTDDVADVRVAALVALAELAAPAAWNDLVAIARAESHAGALAAASRALAAIAGAAGPGQRLDLAPLAGKITQLVAAEDPLVREAAMRLAGLAGGSVPAAAIAPLAADPVPAVRAEALTALGRLAGRGAGTDHLAEDTLVAAFEDPDPALHERAAEALLAAGGRRALEQVLAFVSGEGEPGARAAVAPRIAVPPVEAAHFLPQLDAALDRVAPDDAVYEPLLALKVDLLEAGRDAQVAADPAALDGGIAELFPSFAHFLALDGMAQLVRSIRTAESLYRRAAAAGDPDLSPPIVLWMKVLENYVHAWLGGRMSGLQRDPLALFAHVDVLGAAWPAYQQFVAQRWVDPVRMGAAVVELPVRSLPNALRELQERRRKRLDAALSVTEWARLMVFFAVDHPSGVKNLFKLRVRSADHAVRLAHRLHALAAVRNLVAHRAAASAPTLEAFRRDYYAAFEDLAQLA